MNVIKRNGKEVIFDKTKIINAVTKANEDKQNNSKVRLSTDQIKDIADHIENYCDTNLNRAISVEEIQDMVEDQIISKGFYNIAKCYIKYRYKRTLARQANTTDGVILSLVEQDNEEVKQENSNKNPTIISTQRDYVAGEVSRDITNRLLLPDDVVEAHKEGIIHFHDADYFIQKSFNCCLVNLEDMLQNGTVISGTLIEKPHSFATACNIATQIIAQVASNQYGGQSVSLSHLAPFVDISRQKYIKQVRKEFEDNNIEYTEDMVNNIAESRLLTEIKQGVQMIQYQVLTLMTTNGQTPFITIFMYIDEVPEGKLRDDLALIIRETISLRLKGIKNEQGAYISPAFPKLIYVLEEDNIYEDSKYWDITVLAAKCTAKRLVPDFISEKIMKQLKVDANGEGHCYPVMGCVLGSSVINCKIKNKLYKDITFEEFWNIISKMNLEINKFGMSEYYDISSVVKIYDSYSNKYVVCKKLIKNPNLNNWLELNFDNGTRLVCTEDHPLPKLVKSHSKTIRTKAVNFKIGDSIPVSSLNKTSESVTSLISISKVTINECSYDVETESDHFDVNGINSHNCRSALTPYLDENGKPKYYGRLTNC